MRLSTLALVLVMGFPSKESGAGSSGVLSSQWTQAALAAQTVNLDGSGNIKASAINASIDIAAYRNENVFNPDQYATATIRGGLSSGANYAEVFVRCSGVTSTFAAYQFLTDGASGAGHTELWKYSAGSGTLLTNFPTTFTTGDVMKIGVVGNVITCYKNGAVVGTFTDSAITTGSPGVGVFNSAANNLLLQNFEGGNVAEAYSVGTRRWGPSARGPFDRLGFIKRPAIAYSPPATTGAVNVTPDTGVLQLDGCAPTIGLPITIVPAQGNLTLTGFAAQFPTSILPGSGALALTGQAPTIGLPRTIVPGLGQLTLTGNSPTFPRTIVPGSGALSLSGFAPTFARTILPGFGGLVLDGFSPSFSFVSGGFTLQPGLGALTLTGFGPTIGLPRTIVPGLGALVLTGNAPAIGLPITIRPALGQLTLSGFGPSISFTQPGIFVTPGTGQLTLTGYAPMIGTFTFRIEGGPVMVATLSAGGVLTASIVGGSTFSGGLSGGPV